MSNDLIVKDERFKKLDYAYHFTTFKSLKMIFKSNYLWMTNIFDAKLNDQKEKLYVSDFLRNKIFIFCFSGHINKSLYVHPDYGKGKDIGVALSIDINKIKEFSVKTENDYQFSYIDKTDYNHQSYNSVDDYALRHLYFHKVLYKYDPLSDVYFDKYLYEMFKKKIDIKEEDLIKECTLISHYSYVKEDKWSYEDEYRIVAEIRPKGSEAKMKKEDITIPDHLIDKLCLDISNWYPYMKVYICSEFKYKDELKAICDEKNVTVEIV